METTVIFKLVLRLTDVILTFCFTNHCDIKANDDYTAFQCWLITTFNNKSSRV